MDAATRCQSRTMAWRKVIRRIYSLLYDNHSDFLHLLCQCLALLDERCKCSLMFACMSHDSATVTDVFSYASQFGKQNSCIGRNISFCRERFEIHTDILLDYLVTVYAIASYSSHMVTDTTHYGIYSM
jgi:hypothetical protein